MDEMDVICSFEKWSTKVLIFVQQKLGIDAPTGHPYLTKMQRFNGSVDSLKLLLLQLSDLAETSQKGCMSINSATVSFD